MFLLDQVFRRVTYTKGYDITLSPLKHYEIVSTFPYTSSIPRPKKKTKNDNIRKQPFPKGRVDIIKYSNTEPIEQSPMVILPTKWYEMTMKEKIEFRLQGKRGSFKKNVCDFQTHFGH